MSLGNKIKTKNRSRDYLGSVYNDRTGWAIIDSIKAAGLKIKVRGRHPDRKRLFEFQMIPYKPGRQNDVPIDFADYLAIYKR